MLAVIDEVSPEDWAQVCLEKKVSAVDALVELVDGPPPTKSRMSSVMPQHRCLSKELSADFMRRL